MPPHLSHGVPRQQRRICVPPTQFFCRCTECFVHKYYEVQIDKIKRGQYVTEARYTIHCRRERQRAVAADNYQAFDSPEKSQFTVPDPPAGQFANIPQMMEEELDSKDLNFESAGEDTTAQRVRAIDGQSRGKCSDVYLPPHPRHSCLTNFVDLQTLYL
jgi:hypothetical protein